MGYNSQKKCMRNSIFILVTLFAATFANAQITKIGEVTADNLKVDNDKFATGNVLYSQISQGTQVSIKLYNLSNAYIQEYKTININKMSADNLIDIRQMSRNFFTTDGKICFLYKEISGSYPNYVIEKCQIIDEDGNVVYDVTDKPWYENSVVWSIDGAYYLVLPDLKSSPVKWYIYAIPGNGETQDISSTSAPRYNSRKYVHNAHVLIDSNERTYNMQGQEVR